MSVEVTYAQGLRSAPETSQRVVVKLGSILQALTRDAGPADWPVRPWVVIPEALIRALQGQTQVTNFMLCHKQWIVGRLNQTPVAALVCSIEPL